MSVKNPRKKKTRFAWRGTNISFQKAAIQKKKRLRSARFKGLQTDFVVYKSFVE